MRVTDMMRELLARVVRPGAQVLDATVGWGQDTLWLASRVGQIGKVWGIDCQAKAIAHTRAELRARGLGAVAQLWVGEHGALADWDEGPALRSLDVAVMNLGYLPGEGDAICTKLDQTKVLLAWTLARLRPGGRMLCCVYPGHPEGRAESEWIAAFAPRFPGPLGRSWIHQVANRGPTCPWIWCVDRTKRDGFDVDWTAILAAPENPCDP